MRVILAGTRSFGVAALDALLEDGHDVCAVAAPIDDKLHEHAVWRRRILYNPSVRAEWVDRLDADLIVGAHSHDYVGRKSRDATRLGAIGYHPSLLPLHRGKDAVRWTIRDRDRVAGGTVYWFNDVVDGGPIAAQDWCHVHPGWSASDLWNQALFPMGVALLRRTLEDLDSGLMVQVPQDEALATTEPSFDAPRLYRPELLEIGSGPSGFEVVASREDPRWASRGVK